MLDFVPGVAKHTWIVEEHGIELASYLQYPLKLAYCCTCHKVQGQTFDAAEIDMSRAFGSGMIYVALSRVRSIDGLYIRNINWNRLKVDKRVTDFYDRV